MFDCPTNFSLSPVYAAAILREDRQTEVCRTFAVQALCRAVNSADKLKEST